MVEVAIVITATIFNSINTKFIFTKYEVVFIGTGLYIILIYHRIMRTPTF